MTSGDTPDFFGRDDVQKYMDALNGIDRVDLLALKAQVLVEYRLRHLLAIRMRADPEAIFKSTKNTPAAALIELVLCDEVLKRIRKELLMLNTARVAVAHGLAVDEHEKHLLQFIRAKRGGKAVVGVEPLLRAMWHALYELELVELDLDRGTLESGTSEVAKYERRRSARRSRQA